jgi:hypothetical protein
MSLLSKESQTRHGTSEYESRIAQSDWKILI